jgi:hypothetical protein
MKSIVYKQPPRCDKTIDLIECIERKKMADNIIDFELQVLKKELEEESDLTECDINLTILGECIKTFKENIIGKKLNNKEQKEMSKLAYDLLKFASMKNKEG